MNRLDPTLIAVDNRTRIRITAGSTSGSWKYPPNQVYVLLTSPDRVRLICWFVPAAFCRMVPAPSVSSRDRTPAAGTVTTLQIAATPYTPWDGRVAWVPPALPNG